MFCWKYLKIWCFLNFFKYLLKKMLKLDIDEIFLDVLGFKINRIIIRLSVDNSFILYMLLLYICML